MIRNLYIYHGTGTDPYENLAVEKQLLDKVTPGACILYLWQNQNTVVIGRNQKAWAECRTGLLEEEGGRLARRLSGGGAVFHDLGNLNFTFLMCREDYDVDRQLSVIQAACALAGITAEKSGRNDLLADGRKFSGNAFYQDKLHAYHHGTLMVRVDKEKLGRYLSPSKAKLQAKGVASVRSRVVNLSELAPTLTIATMKTHMAAAFEQVYGSKAESLVFTDADLASVDALRQEYGSWEYLYGATLPFTAEYEARFLWGGILIGIAAKNGVITGCQVFSDAMDWTLPGKVERALTGLRFCREDILKALSPLPYGDDLCKMVAEQALL